jgi:hypothetical protein
MFAILIMMNQNGDRTVTMKWQFFIYYITLNFNWQNTLFRLDSKTKPKKNKVATKKANIFFRVKKKFFLNDFKS